MAKRFIDTGLFDDPFFMELNTPQKVFFIYIITKCNHAGIFQFNKKLAEYQTGINDLTMIIESFNNYLIMVKKPYTYFIPKFIEFQYPKGLTSNKPAIVSVVEELKKYKLLNNDYTIIKDKEIDRDWETR